MAGNNVAKVATVAIITIAVPQVCKFVKKLFKRRPRNNASAPDDSGNVVERVREQDPIETEVDVKQLGLGYSSGPTKEGVNVEPAVTLFSPPAVVLAPTVVVAARELFLKTDRSASSSSSHVSRPANDVIDLGEALVENSEQAPPVDITTNLAEVPGPEVDAGAPLQLSATASNEQPAVSEPSDAESMVQAETGPEFYLETWRGRGRGRGTGRGTGRGMGRGRAFGRGRGGAVGVCLRCRGLGHYAAECNRPFAPMLRTWTVRMKMIGCRIRAEADVAIAWSD